jgi:hypothetical protein
LSEFAGNKPTSTGPGPHIPSASDGATAPLAHVPEVIETQRLGRIVKVLSADGKYVIVPGEASYKPLWGKSGESNFDGVRLLIVPFVAIPNFPGETRLGSRVAVGIFAEGADGRVAVNSYARILAPVPTLMVARVLMLMEKMDQITPASPLLALRMLNGDPSREIMAFKGRVKAKLAAGSEEGLTKLLCADNVYRYAARIVEAAEGRGIVFNGAELSRLMADKKIHPTHAVQNSIRLDQRYSFVGYGLRQEIIDLFKRLKPEDHPTETLDFQRVRDFVRGGQRVTQEISGRLLNGLENLEAHMPTFLASEGFSQIVEAFDGIRDVAERLKQISVEFQRDSTRSPRVIPIAVYAQEFADGFLSIWSTLVRLGAAFRKPTFTEQVPKLTSDQATKLAEQERVTVKLIEVISQSVSRNIGSYYNQ